MRGGTLRVALRSSIASFHRPAPLEVPPTHALLVSQTHALLVPPTHALLVPQTHARSVPLIIPDPTHPRRTQHHIASQITPLLPRTAAQICCLSPMYRVAHSVKNLASAYLLATGMHMV
eukprot:1892593-Rhodomonas_salina.3